MAMAYATSSSVMFGASQNNRSPILFGFSTMAASASSPKHIIGAQTSRNFQILCEEQKVQQRTLAPVEQRWMFTDSDFKGRKLEASTRRSNLCIQSKGTEQSQNGGAGRRRIWRRRKLTKKDEMIKYAQERTPFVEEQVRDIWETGKLVGYDIERLKLWEDNVFVFVRNLAAEANELVENNKDEYGGKKKAILHAISNRMNEMGFYRPEAYMRTDPFKHITKTDDTHEQDD